MVCKLDPQLPILLTQLSHEIVIRVVLSLLDVLGPEADLLPWQRLPLVEVSVEVELVDAVQRLASKRLSFLLQLVQKIVELDLPPGRRWRNEWILAQKVWSDERYLVRKNVVHDQVVIRSGAGLWDGRWDLEEVLSFISLAVSPLPFFWLDHVLLEWLG